MAQNDIVSGLRVIASSPAAMSIVVQDGVVLSADNLVAVNSTTLSIEPSTVNARFDSIILNADHSLSVLTTGGTTTVGAVPIAKIYVRSGIFKIENSDITNLDTTISWNNLDNISSLVRRVAAIVSGYQQNGISSSAIAASVATNAVFSADLAITADAGTSASMDSAYLTALFGNVIDNGDPLAKTHNYIGGSISHYSITNTNASTYPKGAVLAGIGDTSTSANGAIVSYIDGDSGVTTAPAAFKVMSNNSHAGSGFDFGLDLQDTAHDGYLAVDNAFYRKAPFRMPNDFVIMTSAGAPTNGVTGANFTGPGSLCIDQSGKNVYINANTISSPTWKLITRAS